MEQEEIKIISYASAVESFMYAQVGTRSDIAFAIGMLGKYQKDPSMEDWKGNKEGYGIPSRNQGL